jgi:mRNA interferase MazF
MAAFARGQIIWINFDPASGHEQSFWRPALIVSNGLVHPRVAPVAVVVPITKQGKGLPFEVPVPDGIPVNGALVGKPNLTELSGYALPFQLKSQDLSSQDAIVIGQIDPDHPFYKEVEEQVSILLFG